MPTNAWNPKELTPLQGSSIFSVLCPSITGGYFKTAIEILRSWPHPGRGPEVFTPRKEVGMATYLLVFSGSTF
jgi:hypothetical protein